MDTAFPRPHAKESGMPEPRPIYDYPLYRYSADRKPGVNNGQDLTVFGGRFRSFAKEATTWSSMW
jgi:hypothetical protein